MGQSTVYDVITRYRVDAHGAAAGCERAARRFGERPIRRAPLPCRGCPGVVGLVERGETPAPRALGR